MTIVIRKRARILGIRVYGKEKARQSLRNKGLCGVQRGETVIIDDDWQRGHRRRLRFNALLRGQLNNVRVQTYRNH